MAYRKKTIIYVLLMLVEGILLFLYLFRWDELMSSPFLTGAYSLFVVFALVMELIKLVPKSNKFLYRIRVYFFGEKAERTPPQKEKTVYDKVVESEDKPLVDDPDDDFGNGDYSPDSEGKNDHGKEV